MSTPRPRLVTAEDELERIERAVRRSLLANTELTFSDLADICDASPLDLRRVVRGLLRGGVVSWDADSPDGPALRLTRAGECAERARLEVRHLVTRAEAP